MSAPAVAEGKGVKGERECRHCLRFLALRPPNGSLRIDAIIVTRHAFGAPRIVLARSASRGSLPAGEIFAVLFSEIITIE